MRWQTFERNTQLQLILTFKTDMTSFTGGLSSPFKAGLTVLDKTSLLRTKPLVKQESRRKLIWTTRIKASFLKRSLLTFSLVGANSEISFRYLSKNLNTGVFAQASAMSRFREKLKRLRLTWGCSRKKSRHRFYSEPSKIQNNGEAIYLTQNSISRLNHAKMKLWVDGGNGLTTGLM